MGATFGTYLARNETTDLVDDSVLCIELGHTSSLLRPIGNNWNELWILVRMALSGSPATGNMTQSYCFVGLCSGEKRYSQTSASAALIGSHCIGWFSNSVSSSVTATGTTNTRTDPASQNTYFTINSPNYLGMMATGSYRAGNTGYSVQWPRYETQWSSSLPSNVYNRIGNNFGCFVVRISKGSTWTLGGGSWLYSGYTITSSINLPVNSIKSAMYGADIVTTGMRDELYYYARNLLGGTNGNNYWNISWNSYTIPAGNPNTGSFGDFDTLNIYYRNTAYPNSKLLIKDLIVLRTL